MTQDEKLTMSIPEAAALLGCSRNHAYKMVHEGVIPTIKIGRKLVVPKERFLKWVNGE